MKHCLECRSPLTENEDIVCDSCLAYEIQAEAQLILSEEGFHEGDKVWWEDPDDGECSHAGVVSEVNGEIIHVKDEDGCITDAFDYELTHI